jgi:UDP-glucose 4-epimerase
MLSSYMRKIRKYYAEEYITGGAGFIGGHLAESFSHEAEVRVLDDFSNGCRGLAEQLKSINGVNIQEGSILDGGLLMAAMREVDVVFHLAAVVSVPECIRREMHCHEVNATGTLKVLEAATLCGVQKVFLASSAAVYGSDPATVPIAESSALVPETPYAIAKLMSEQYGQYFSRSGKVRVASLRFFNVFGRRQSQHGPYAAVVARFIAAAIRGQTMVINGDGGQTRDFIDVKDVVRAIRHVTLTEHITGVYNVGSGRALRGCNVCSVKGFSLALQAPPGAAE